MRKAVTNGSTTPKDAGRRRYWVRTPGEPPAGSGERRGESGRPQKARFLEPYHFSDAEREALAGALAAGKVGDHESRDLFISAIEYDLASLRQSEPARAAPRTPPEAPPPPVETAPAAPAAAPAGAPAAAAEATAQSPVARAARALAQSLGALESGHRAALAQSLGASDPFGREYPDRYFEILEAELTRLADAAATLDGAETGPRGLTTAEASSCAPETAREAPPTPAGGAPESPPSPAVLRFVSRVARVYGEVLEAPPSADPEGPFCAVLRLIEEQAGVSLPHRPETLASALGKR